MKKKSDPKTKKQGSSVELLQQALDKKAQSEESSPEQVKDGSQIQASEEKVTQPESDKKGHNNEPQSGAVAESTVVPEAEPMTQAPQKTINAIEQEVVDARAEQVAPAKEQTITTEPQSQEVVTKSKTSVAGLVAIVLVILLAGAGYYFYLKLDKQLSANTDKAAKLTTQQLTEHDKTRQKMTIELESARQEIQVLSGRVATSEKTQALLQDRLQVLSGRRPNDWLLAEANYLVKLAGRKLWQERDQQTAGSLLATADLRIAEMNDPSLISLRKALAKDIAALQSLPKDQTESIALRIDGLISQVDNLKLNTVKLPEPVADVASDQLSASPSDWRENITKTWQSFLEGFITVRRRSGSVEPLMSPKQQWYLEENLKTKLIQSQLALYRHQQDAFEHAIELSTRWVMQFYDRQDSTTEFMLKEFSQLQQLDIAIDYPKEFSSSDLLYAELTNRSITASNSQGR